MHATHLVADDDATLLHRPLPVARDRVREWQQAGHLFQCGHPQHAWWIQVSSIQQGRCQPVRTAHDRSDVFKYACWTRYSQRCLQVRACVYVTYMQVVDLSSAPELVICSLQAN